MIKVPFKKKREVILFLELMQSQHKCVTINRILETQLACILPPTNSICVAYLVMCYLMLAQTLYLEIL